MNKIYQYNSKGHLAVVEDYDPSTMVIHTLTPDMRLSQAQLTMIEDAERYPIVYEDDCPELTPEMAEAFRRAARARDGRKQLENMAVN